MKSNNLTTFIIVAGILILIVFSVVATYNLMPNNVESDPYYSKIEADMEAKIEILWIKDGNLHINTSGTVDEYCVKTTKTRPSDEAFCWKQFERNYASIPVFSSKTYYVWIKDIQGNISNYSVINS